MENVGNWLREAREGRGISLEDAEAVTRIRARYLEALETGDYGAMAGGESQVKGFLRRYASFLGLSADEANTRYERDVHGGRTESAPVVPPPPVSAPAGGIALVPPAGRGLPVSVVVVGLVAVVALLGVGSWWLVSRSGLLGDRGATPMPAATSGALSPLPSPQGGAVTAEAPAVTPTFPVSASGGVTITLGSTEHVWVRVTVDGAVSDETLLAPGMPITRTAQELVVVETGNGAGVTAVVNGQPQGALGNRGELCARGWGPQGEIEVPPPVVATPIPESEPP